MVICFSDQNFVSSLAAGNGRCLNIVRLENASLLELLELAKEVLCNVRLLEGSVLLFGSGSHLGRSGSLFMPVSGCQWWHRRPPFGRAYTFAL